MQNLIWGLAQPFTGALADRFGAAKVVLIGGVLYAAGLMCMGLSDSPMTLSLSAGLLIGIGLSGTSFSVILGVVGRAVPPEKRSMGMGIASDRPVGDDAQGQAFASARARTNLG
ncbi:multidrug resistance protein MdtH [compost metagenome]